MNTESHHAGHKGQKKHTVAALLFLLPAALSLGIFVFYPFFRSIYLSFFLEALLPTGAEPKSRPCLCFYLFTATPLTYRV